MEYVDRSVHSLLIYILPNNSMNNFHNVGSQFEVISSSSQYCIVLEYILINTLTKIN